MNSLFFFCYPTVGHSLQHVIHANPVNFVAVFFAAAILRITWLPFLGSIEHAVYLDIIALYTVDIYNICSQTTRYLIKKNQRNQQTVSKFSVNFNIRPYITLQILFKLNQEWGIDFTPVSHSQAAFNIYARH